MSYRSPFRDLLCKIDGCTSKARQRGRCKKHYKIWRAENPIPSQHKELFLKAASDGSGRSVEVPRVISLLPYWDIWWSREKDTVWPNIRAMVNDIHPSKPAKTGWRLVKKDTSKPYGPENFQWRPFVRRVPGESMSIYAARLRKEQAIRDPNAQWRGQIKFNYNLTQAQFEQMLRDQSGLCAICNRPETLPSRKGGKIRQLAIDHCHKTNKVRALLCHACNVTLGQVDESIERLQAMIVYLQRHSAAEAPVIACD